MMWVRVLVLGVIGGFVCQGLVFAASVEIPQEQAKLAQNFAVEFIYSQTFERKLAASADETDKIKSLEQGHFKIAYTGFSYAQPYVKMGFSKPQEKLVNTYVQNLGRRDIDIEYNYSFSYGGGLDGAVRIDDNWFLGYDMQYLRSTHSPKEITQQGVKGTSLAGKTLLQEWHSALSLGRKFQLMTLDTANLKSVPLYLTPYLGIRYSDLRLKTKRDITYALSGGGMDISGESKADVNYGLFTGLLFNVGDNVSLKLEGRFIDEAALSIAGGYKF